MDNHLTYDFDELLVSLLMGDNSTCIFTVLPHHFLKYDNIRSFQALKIKDTNDHGMLLHTAIINSSIKCLKFIVNGGLGDKLIPITKWIANDLMKSSNEICNIVVNGTHTDTEPIIREFLIINHKLL